MKLSSGLQNVRGEGAFAVLVKARRLEAQGRDVVHMEIVEPDFQTPRHIVEAGLRPLGPFPMLKSRERRDKPACCWD